MSDFVPPSLVSLDNLWRCFQVLSTGVAEEEFLRVLQLQEKFRLESVHTAQEVQRIQNELDSSLKNMADLEAKLFHARRLLELETKARREAEHERDQMEKKILAVADLLQHERNLKDETKDKLAFLNTLPRKRRSVRPHLDEKYGNDINSTGSFLSDLSITQSEDDFLEPNSSRNWQKHRPSITRPSPRHSRKSGNINERVEMRDPSLKSTAPNRQRSNGEHKKMTLDLGKAEKICATTKVSIPQDGNGAIRAESTIESTPMRQRTKVNGLRTVDEIGVPPNMTTPRHSYKKSVTTDKLPPTATAPNTPNILSTPNCKSRANLRRQHNFTSKTFIRTDSCVHCQKKIRFGTVGLRCRDCPVRCHLDCRRALTVSCVPQSTTPTSKLMGYLSDYTPPMSPMIPALIVHCVNEIESRGLTEVGIYRVSGSEREVKALKERFLRGKVTPHLGNVDVHVLCGCIKDFLRSLREPLVPTDLWKDFCNAVQNTASDDDIRNDLHRAIGAMPQSNRDTLAFLILHLQRVAESPEVRMPIENISRVFGPTIVGYSTADPDQQAIFTEVFTQCSVMQNLIKMPSDYWLQYVALSNDKENDNVPTMKRVLKENNNEPLSTLYATPMKSASKKRRVYATPTAPHPK